MENSVNRILPSVQEDLNPVIPARQDLPAEILEYRQWVAWRYGEVRENGKCPKQPINPRTGKLAKANGPETWASYGTAVSAAKLYGLAGVGFMFSQDDPFVGVDLDDCIEDGEIAPWALNIVSKLGSYAEISPSGTGIKAIVKGSLPTDSTGVRRGPVELYQHGRFFTITGETLEPGKAVTEAQVALDSLYHTVVSGRDGKATRGRTEATAPVAKSSGVSGDDERLLEKAARKKPFPALYYAGNISGFKSQSDADLALCGALAFWTGKDAGRIDRLFRGSALYREKWERADYRQSTIEAAISRCRNVYTGETPTEGREDVIARFQAEREAVDRLAFDWRGGDTDYKLAHAFIDTGGVVGSISRGCPTVAMAERDLLTEAGIGSRNTVRRGEERLAERGLIKVVEPGGKRTATTYRLRFAEASPAPSPKVDHKGTHTTVSTMDQDWRHRTNVTKMRAPYSPPRKRYDKNGRPAPNHTGDLEKRLPARCGQILWLIKANPGVSLEEIASHLEMNTKNGRYNIKRRNLEPLSSFGLVEERDGGYYPTEDHEERFAEYLEQSGCNAAEQRQRDRIERERLAYELHGLEQKIAYDFEQSDYDPGESIPELVEPIPETEDSYSEEPRGLPRTDAPEPARGAVPTAATKPIHPMLCECIDCSVPAPKYAVPKPYPTDSGRPRIAPREPIPTYANPGDLAYRQSAAA